MNNLHLQDILKHVNAILEQRGKEYGSFSDVSTKTLNFLELNKKDLDYYLSIGTITKEQFASCYLALLMIGVKTARIEQELKNGINVIEQKTDSLLDLFGYATLFKRLNIDITFNIDDSLSEECKNILKYVKDYVKGI